MSPEPGRPRPGQAVPGPWPPAAARILVIRLGALGDVVRTRFAFAGLRALYPEARIDWLVDDRAAAGLSGLVGLDRVHQVPRSGLRWRRAWQGLGRISRLIEELRLSRYDLSVDFHGILRSAALAWLARVPMRVGYGRGLAREGSEILVTHRVELEILGIRPKEPPNESGGEPHGYWVVSAIVVADEPWPEE